MASVEALHERLRVLVARRQTLHDSNAGRDDLESNRLELVTTQRQLSPD